MANKITIYTRTTCAYCAQVKRYLDIKQKTYDVINLDEKPEAAAAIIAKSGARTVPIVTLTDDSGTESIAAIGWNPSALATLAAA